MAGSSSTVGNCNAHESVSVLVCHSSEDMEAVTYLATELRGYSYTSFSDTVVSNRELEVHLSVHGRINNRDTCKLGLIFWSESFVKHFSKDTALHLQTLAEHNVPVLHVLYELNISDLKDLSLWSQLDLVKSEPDAENSDVKDLEGIDLWSQLDLLQSLEGSEAIGLWSQLDLGNSMLDFENSDLKDSDCSDLWSQRDLAKSELDSENSDLEDSQGSYEGSLVKSEPDAENSKLGSPPDSEEGRQWSMLDLQTSKLLRQLELVEGRKSQRDPEKRKLLSVHGVTKISDWISNLDATNALVYDGMATNFADFARLVADKAAHIALLKTCPSNREQVQDKEELCQDLKDKYIPDFQRDYPAVMRECKLVTVSYSSEDPCDEFASMLAAELKKMSYDIIITGLDCSDAEKDQVLLQSSLRLFVLSDSFFRRKECLMDVIKNAHAPMISLFYNLSMSEFRNEKRRELWRKEWSCWNKRDDSKTNWERAVEVLESCNDIEYSSLSPNIKHYLQAVAMAVSHYVPFQVVWSYESSHVQGKIQMCEMVDALFQSKALLIHGGTQVLGVHGIWGVGKSALGKALCDFYSPEFAGRVCYVELGLTPRSGSNVVRLHQLKRILQELFEVDADFLEWYVRDLGQANAYLDYCLDQASKKVFLVIDNIQGSLQSFEEARELFTRKVPFPMGSKVLLLARSPHTLRELLQPLESSYGSVVDFPWSILRTVHDQIFCQAVDWAGGAHFSAQMVLNIFRDFFPEFCQSSHPLTIKSFAFFARSLNPLIRDVALKTEPILEHFEPHERVQSPAYLITWKHLHRLVRDGLLDCVFETLQKSYDLFDSKEQKLFLDVALYMPGTSIHQLQQLHDSTDEQFSTTIKCLQKLRDEVFLLFMGREIQMPAVCRYFAERVVERDWSKEMVHIARQSVQWARMHDNVLKASNLGRIALESCHFVQGNDNYDCFTLDLSSCKYLSVLRLWGNMSEKRIEVRLGRCAVLERLEVLCNTCPFTLTGNFLHVKCFKGDYSVLGVVCLDFDVILPKSLQALEIFMPTDKINLLDFTKCINVAVLRLHGHVSYDFCPTGGFISQVGRWNGFGKLFDLRYWISLRELVLEDVVDLSHIRGLDHLCNLRSLHLGRLNDLKYLKGMEELSKLEEFHLLDCSNVYYITLPGSSRLRHCCIYRCERLFNIDIRQVEPAGESDHSDEEDEGFAEEKRCWLQYDANMWRGWSRNGSLLLHPDGHTYGDHRQDQRRSCFRFDTSVGSSNLGPTVKSGEQHVHKFMVWGCPFAYAHPLSALTEIHNFEFAQQDGSDRMLLQFFSCQALSKAQHVSIGFHFKIRGFAIERGESKLTSAAKLSYLDVAEVHDAEALKWLMVHLQKEDGLKKLAIECGSFLSCGCNTDPPCFSLLCQSVTELKYGCPRVSDLSGMNSLVQVTSLDLKGCKNVKIWPDFSQMSTLSFLDLRNTSWKGPHPFNTAVPSSM